MRSIVQRSERLLHEIRLGRRKLVGWGTGSSFRSQYARCALHLEYLIDNDARKWGSFTSGLPIHPPTILKSEDPERILVLTFSSFVREIEVQLSELGPFESISAGHLLLDEHAVGRICSICATADALTLPPPRTKRPRGAIVIQGPIIEEVTLTALRYYRATQPDTALVVATWRGQSADTLEVIESWCDRLLLIDPPRIAGRQNRNLQAASSLAGLRAARDLGVSNAFKTRSDCVLGRSCLLELTARACALYPAHEAHARGLHGRIAVTSSYTRKWIPYHPSDLVMFGALDDLIRYWTLPDDTAARNADWTGLSLVELSRQCIPSETYAGRCFARAIGRPLCDTVTDSWSFYRDYMIVLDDSWFDMVWAKNPAGAPGASSRTCSDCVDHAFWQHLIFGLPLPSSIDALAEKNTWSSETTNTPI